MGKSDFREDREFSYDPPSDDATLAERLEYQRHLRRRWDACEKPGDCLDIPMEDPDKWWTHPTNPSSEQIQQQIKRQMKRYEQR